MKGKKSSEIFLLIFTILLALLIIHIFERYLMYLLDEKKTKISILFFKKYFDNINRSKIILYLALISIVIILINPIRLITIFNPYIFNIFGSQFTDIIKISKAIALCDENNVNYIRNKPFETYRFNKLPHEIVFNHKPIKVLNRLKGEFDEQQLCDIIYSINIDNELEKISTIDFKRVVDGYRSNNDYFSESENNELNKFNINQIKIIKNIANNSDIDKPTIYLDENRHNKFSYFNNVLHEVPVDNYNSNIFLHEGLITLILTIYFLLDLIIIVYNFSSFTSKFNAQFAEVDSVEDLENKNRLKDSFKKVNNNYYIIKTQLENSLGNYYILLTIFIIYLILQLNSGASWLKKTELNISNNSKYTVLILYLFSLLPRLVFKYNKYVSADTFMLINLSIIIANVCILYYIGKSGLLKLYLMPEQYFKDYVYDHIENIINNLNSNSDEGKNISSLHPEGINFSSILESLEEKLIKSDNTDLKIKHYKTALDKIKKHTYYKIHLFKTDIFNINNLFIHILVLLILAIMDIFSRYYYKNSKDKYIYYATSYYLLSNLYLMLIIGINIYNTGSVMRKKGRARYADNETWIEEGKSNLLFSKHRKWSNNSVERNVGNWAKALGKAGRWTYASLYKTGIGETVVAILSLVYIVIIVISFLFIIDNNDMWISEIYLKKVKVNLPTTKHDPYENNLDYKSFSLSYLSEYLNLMGLDEKQLPTIFNGFMLGASAYFFIIMVYNVWLTKARLKALPMIIFIIILVLLRLTQDLRNQHMDGIAIAKKITLIITTIIFIICNISYKEQYGEFTYINDDIPSISSVIFILLFVSNIFTYFKLFTEPLKEINNTVDKQLYYLIPTYIVILIIMYIYIQNSKSSSYKGGGKYITNYTNICIFLIIVFIIYNMFYKKKHIKGGNKKSEQLGLKSTDSVNYNIGLIITVLVLVIILYYLGLLYTENLTDFVSYSFLNYSNLNKLRLLTFPFVILVFIYSIMGFKIIKTIIIRQIEKTALNNIERGDTKSINQKYNKNKKEDLMSYQNFIRVKYASILVVVLWYLFLINSGKMEFNSMFVINLIILFFYIYFIQYVLYIFYKIYINENVNKIDQEVKKVNKIKTKIKFVKGKINPAALEEIIELNESKLKVHFEEFMNTLYIDLHNILTVNNIFLTSAIEIYIKRKLITHKALEEEFKLKTSIEENRKIELEKRRKLKNTNPLPPIPENIYMKLNLSGKWTNIKDDNNIILYIYNNIGVVLYFNKKQYQSLKLTTIVQKSNYYEFIYDNKLEFTYDNKNIIIDNIPYSKLSNEFTTDNIIKKTLRENDVFKNLNYMITIDEDSKYIGKYNIIENLTNYNYYKKQGDPISTILEQLIMNKILLIKAIKSKNYKNADMYNKLIEKLEKKYKKRKIYYKYDSNRDGIIDANEIENYIDANTKLSDIGKIKIVSAIYDGTHLYIKFDKSVEKQISATTVSSHIPIQNANIYFDINDLVVFNNNITDSTGNTIKVYANKIYKISYSNNSYITLENVGYGSGNGAVARSTAVGVAAGDIIPTGTTIKKVQYKQVAAATSSTKTLANINKHFKSDDFVILDKREAGVLDLLKIKSITRPDTFTLDIVNSDSTTAITSTPQTNIFKVDAHKIPQGNIRNSTIILPNARSYFKKGDIVMFNSNILNSSGFSGGIAKSTEYKIKEFTTTGIKLSSLGDQDITISDTTIGGNTYIYTYKNSYYDFPIKLNNNNYIHNKIVEKIDSKTFKIELKDDTIKDTIEKNSNNKITLELDIKGKPINNKTVKLHKTINNFAEFDPTIFDP